MITAVGNISKRHKLKCQYKANYISQNIRAILGVLKNKTDLRREQTVQHQLKINDNLVVQAIFFMMYKQFRDVFRSLLL